MIYNYFHLSTESLLRQNNVINIKLISIKSGLVSLTDHEKI